MNVFFWKNKFKSVQNVLGHIGFHDVSSLNMCPCDSVSGKFFFYKNDGCHTCNEDDSLSFALLLQNRYIYYMQEANIINLSIS